MIEVRVPRRLPRTSVASWGLSQPLPTFLLATRSPRTTAHSTQALDTKARLQTDSHLWPCTKQPSPSNPSRSARPSRLLIRLGLAEDRP
ncbi:hypothetical protein KC335_g49 [Hortaea werneckii]|nr:hypothetical protein KC335_g49 [Hortaea werneckii]